MDSHQLDKEVEDNLSHPLLQQLQSVWREVTFPKSGSTDIQRLGHVQKRMATIMAKVSLLEGERAIEHVNAINAASAIQEGYSRSANEIAEKNLTLQGEVKELTTKIKELTTGIHDLAVSQNETNKKVQDRIDAVNRGMIALTILGVILATFGAHYANRSVELDQEALALQKRQEAAQNDPRAASAKQTTTPSAGIAPRAIDAIPDPKSAGDTGASPENQPPTPEPSQQDAPKPDA